MEIELDLVRSVGGQSCLGGGNLRGGREVIRLAGFVQRRREFDRFSQGVMQLDRNGVDAIGLGGEHLRPAAVFVGGNDRRIIGLDRRGDQRESIGLAVEA